MKDIVRIIKEYFTDSESRPTIPDILLGSVLGVVVGILWSVHTGWWMIIIGGAISILFFIAWNLTGFYRGYTRGWSKAASEHDLLKRYEDAMAEINQMNEEIFGNNEEEVTEEDLPDEDEDLFV